MDHLKCTTCNKGADSSTKLKKCGGCESALYCSTSCQKEDWRTHKLICDEFKTFPVANPRPSTDHRLALLLPKEGGNPKLLWYQTYLMKSPYAGYEMINYSQHLGDDDPSPEEINVSMYLTNTYIGVEKYAFDHTVSIQIRESGEFDGSHPNQCVSEVMKGTQGYDWKGPIVVYSQPGTSIDSPTFLDVTAADLRIVVDFLRHCGGKADDFVQTVRISSKGDEKLHGKRKFYHIKVPDSHEIFNTRPTEISTIMGLPILVQKTGLFNPADVEKGSRLGFNPFENYTAAALNTIATPQNDYWGSLDMQDWDMVIGTVLVVRQDKKDMSTGQVEALARFCREVLRPAMAALEDSFFCPTGIPDRDDVWAAREEFVKTQMTREAFEIFLEKLKAEKVAAGDSSWDRVVSPYSV
ncbi:uncharacterized protein L3040_006230 [Drepanopeziza brunnea f. sp. 'multigermtubi']|uniref:MYND domain protein, putative n=1 Tax=Marssonina brunnea f. sp. multigermtubi (strain MB_m1) TaxID=1072389 RepID=K1XW19_MARBU|nr:MYND domain protein, putative [Drepanopeziza brunnea f. sp. 'multigermtubi' MB_m1]EKD16944.1 MYND domain protein, putative [Drepanopeziza brunnea f. sp. 'multigermtubi' MB_m1]KAJ5040578.1 hypothetical protein L3040_006230 [Drepanopeziza brunnea f. sp. 'multigermtubi']